MFLSTRARLGRWWYELGHARFNARTKKQQKGAPPLVGARSGGSRDRGDRVVGTWSGVGIGHGLGDGVGDDDSL